MNRRKFLKACAALGVTVSVPGMVHVSHKIAGGGLVEPDFIVGSPPGRIYFVPGDADTLAEAIQLAGACQDAYQKQRWSATDAGAIRDLERWGER